METQFKNTIFFTIISLVLFSCKSTTVYKMYDSKDAEQIMIARYHHDVYATSHPLSYKGYLYGNFGIQEKPLYKLSKEEYLEYFTKKLYEGKSYKELVKKKRKKEKFVKKHESKSKREIYFWDHPKQYSFNGGMQYDTESELEIQKVDSIVKSGTIKKLRGKWYKKEFPASTIEYMRNSARLGSIKSFYGVNSSSYSEKEILQLAENYRFNLKDPWWETPLLDYLVYVIQPKYLLLFGKQQGKEFIVKKLILLGEHIPFSENQKEKNKFEYYHDGKSFYKLSHSAYEALDKYLKHKMLLKQSILKEKWKKEKEEEKKKDSDTK